MASEGTSDVEKQLQSERSPARDLEETDDMKKTSSPNNTKKVLILAASLVVLAGIVCGITIPLVNRKNRNAQSSVVSANNGNEEKSTDGSMTDTPKSFQTNGVNGTGIFNSSIELLSPSVARGYSSDEELEESINNAANFFLGISYKENSNGGSNDVENSPVADMNTGNLESSPAVSDGGAGSTLSSSKTAKVEGDSYGTNNQEEGIEEGDMVVSDGDFVYAGYGKYLVVWSVDTGVVVRTLEMTPVNQTATATNASDTEAKVSGFYYTPEPYIMSLLLHNGRLLVLVGGYENRYIDFSSSYDMYKHVLYNYLSTDVRLYDTSLLVQSPSSDVVSAETGLIGSKLVNGAYSAVRSKNGVAHIVTLSGLNNDQYLASPLQRSVASSNVEEVGQNASRRYTMQLMSDLRAGTSDGSSVPKLSRISAWQTSHSENGTLEELNYRLGLMNSLVLIHSIDLMAQSTTSDMLTYASSGSFIPSYAVQVYGADDKIILAANVYEYDENTMSSSESTGFLVFNLDGASAKSVGVGTSPGYLLNSYAMDVVGKYLRFATTVRNQTWTMIDAVQAFEPIESDGESTMTSTASEKKVASSDAAMVIDTMPVNFDVATENYIIVMELPSGQTDADGSESLATMVEVGRVQIGKPKESITAVRFFDNVTYAVTFEKTDPFYVLDLSNPTNPTILAELNITGFSSYLHPINSEHTLLLAVGEEADLDGVSQGLQITIFDATDARNPRVLHRHQILKENNTYAYSDTQWDFKSFRYAEGYLFLPVDKYVDYYLNNNTNLKPFHGTMVFKIDAVSGIEEVVPCRVSHSLDYYEINPYPVDTNGTSGEAPTVCNYSGGYLPRRSMIFGGDLMSIRNSEIIMEDLGSCQQLWNTSIAIPSDNGCDQPTILY